MGVRGTLPEYLKKLRREGKYKQDDIAALLHITRQTYSHYETGRVRPPAGRLYQLAKFYGVPVEGMLACGEHETVGEGRNGWEIDPVLLDKGFLNPQGSGELPGKGQNDESIDCSLEAFLYHYWQLSEKDKIEIISLMKIKEKIHGQPENR